MKYDKYVTTKGQLISKGHFGVFKATKKSMKSYFKRISALASKKK